MAIGTIPQPECIPIRSGLRLRKFDGDHTRFLPGYQDPVVYQNSEGIFDESRIPDLEYMQRMCAYLSRVGELYLIEVEENGVFTAIGDVTVKDENPPIAIWRGEYRGKGIGTEVMKAVVGRLRELGFKKITGSTVYRWNTASQRLHEKLGFRCVGEDERELTYELALEDGAEYGS